MKHEVAKYPVTKAMVEYASPRICGAYLMDYEAVFPDPYLMHVTADKAGLVIRDYHEVHGRAPEHRYAEAQFESDQCDGEIDRVSNCHSRDDTKLNIVGPTFENWEEVVEWLTPDDEYNTWVQPTYQEVEMPVVEDVDVSTGRLHAAAHNKAQDHVINSEVQTEVDRYVSGQHYNDVVPGMQYMEMMQYMLEGKTGVEAHLFGQVYKYLMRAGKKDDYEQDIRKAKWYISCLTKFIQTGEIDVENNDQ